MSIPLLVVCDHRLFAGDPARLLEVVAACLRGGARAVEVGGAHASAHDVLAMALALREVTRQLDALLLVAERADVALAAEADGVRLSRESIPAPAVRRLAQCVTSSFLVGRTVLTVQEAALAHLESADFLVVTPVWPHPGLEALRAVAASVRRPVLAGGGVKPEEVPAVREAGAAGLVLGAEVLDAPDPERETARYLSAWQG